MTNDERTRQSEKILELYKKNEIGRPKRKEGSNSFWRLFNFSEGEQVALDEVIRFVFQHYYEEMIKQDTAYRRNEMNFLELKEEFAKKYFEYAMNFIKYSGLFPENLQFALEFAFMDVMESIKTFEVKEKREIKLQLLYIKMISGFLYRGEIKYAFELSSQIASINAKVGDYEVLYKESNLL